MQVDKQSSRRWRGVRGQVSVVGGEKGARSCGANIALAVVRSPSQFRSTRRYVFALNIETQVIDSWHGDLFLPLPHGIKNIRGSIAVSERQHLV